MLIRTRRIFLLKCSNCGADVERTCHRNYFICVPCKAQYRRDYINAKNAKKREFLKPERQEKAKLREKVRHLAQKKKAKLRKEVEKRIKARKKRVLKERIARAKLPKVYIPK